MSTPLEDAEARTIESRMTRLTHRDRFELSILLARVVTTHARLERLYGELARAREREHFAQRNGQGPLFEVVGELWL